MRRTRAQWSRLVAEWQRSGLSTRAFAQRRGLAARSLAWWRWRLAADEGGGEEEPTRLVTVDVDEETRAEHRVWELATAGGDVLRVYGIIAPEALAQVLAVIARRSR